MTASAATGPGGPIGSSKSCDCANSLILSSLTNIDLRSFVRRLLRDRRLALGVLLPDHVATLGCARRSVARPKEIGRVRHHGRKIRLRSTPEIGRPYVQRILCEIAAPVAAFRSLCR